MIHDQEDEKLPSGIIQYKYIPVYATHDLDNRHKAHCITNAPPAFKKLIYYLIICKLFIMSFMYILEHKEGSTTMLTFENLLHLAYVIHPTLQLCLKKFHETHPVNHHINIIWKYIDSYIDYTNNGELVYSELKRFFKAGEKYECQFPGTFRYSLYYGPDIISHCFGHLV